MFIYLIRHGQTEGNKERRVMGQTPVPLNESGRTGVAALARELKMKKIPVIYSSTVERALGAVAHIVGEVKMGRAAAVSHSDVIKPVLAHYLGMDLDAIHRLSIANASSSLIDFKEAPPRIRYINFAPWQWRGTP